MNSPDMSREAAAIARYIYETGHLKSTPRSGWALAGITQSESVADHVFRVAVIGFLLASAENADPARTVMLCLFHDTPETRTGDIPSVGKKYIDVVPEDVVSDQTRGMPPMLADAIRELVSDYERKTTFEAQLAKDADKLECLAQAIEYVAAGTDDARFWIDALADGIVSPTGKQWAVALRASTPNEWWRRFVASYRGAAGDVADL